MIQKISGLYFELIINHCHNYNSNLLTKKPMNLRR